MAQNAAAWLLLGAVYRDCITPLNICTGLSITRSYLHTCEGPLVAFQE